MENIMYGEILYTSKCKSETFAHVFCANAVNVHQEEVQNH